MKKFYKIILLFLVLTFLTTYNPHKFNPSDKKKDFFFKIKNIEITNTNLINKDIIYQKLHKIYQKNILFIDRKDVEQPLKSIDFLEKIDVKKKYPNTIIIKVYESKPIAILYKKNTKYIIDSLSNLISYDKKIVLKDLPGVFGESSNLDFINFFDLLKNNDFPNEKIKNFYYFQIGRWDLELSNNQLIKFPPDKIKEAIKQSIELLNRDDFKNYNVIDLRMHGNIVVE